MLYRILFGAAASAGAGVLIFSGAVPFVGAAYDSNAYQQEVPATPGQVVTALEDTDFLHLQLANPASGLIDVQRQQAGNGWNWALRVDGKHVLDMAAAVEPLQGGGASRVIASVRPGPDHASPDLSSGLKDLAMVRALLAAAVEYELHSLAAPEQRLSAADNKKRKQNRFMKAVQVQVLRDPTAPMKDAVKAEREFGDFEAQADQALQEAERAAGGWGGAPAQPSGEWGQQPAPSPTRP